MSKHQKTRKFLTSSSSSEDEEEDEDIIVHKPRILYTPNGDQILELTIETLMGTTFEVRLPAKTLVSSIKNRLQRSEGVPRHHLHIIHQGRFTMQYIFMIASNLFMSGFFFIHYHCAIVS